MKMRMIAVPAVAAFLALGLSACSSDSDDTTPVVPSPPASSAPASESAAPVASESASPAVDASAAPSESMVGGDPSTWTPLYITPETAEVQMVPGQVALLDDAVTAAAAGGEVVLTSSNEAVIVPVQPTENTVGSINAVGVGDAELTVQAGDTTVKVKVVVAAPAEAQ